MSAGIRPMAFERAADGSTSRIFVQLSDYHGIAVVDFKERKEVTRFETPAIPGETKHTEGLQAAPMHGFAVTPDGKLLLATSKVYSTMYAYSLPDLKPVGHVHVGQHPEWVDSDAGWQAGLRRRGRGQRRKCRGYCNFEGNCSYTSRSGSEAEWDGLAAAVEGTCHHFTEYVKRLGKGRPRYNGGYP